MARPDIYDQHDKAFPHVSAYVVMRDGARVATIAFRYPRDGASRLWCYLHWLGLPMVRGYAAGYGYDKRSAAIEAAARAIKPTPEKAVSEGLAAFNAAVSDCGGWGWDSKLRDAGFEVLQAV